MKNPTRAEEIAAADAARAKAKADRAAFERERDALVRKLDDRQLGPCPVPGKHIDEMTLTELELMERWMGVSIDVDERLRRRRIREEERGVRR